MSPFLVPITPTWNDRYEVIVFGFLVVILLLHPATVCLKHIRPNWRIGFPATGNRNRGDAVSIHSGNSIIAGCEIGTIATGGAKTQR